jgi:hypothetical protein
LSADGMTAAIKTGKAPALGGEYVLTVSGVRDGSPAANTISPARSVNFSITPPVFELKFSGKDNSISLGTVPPGRDFTLQGKPEIQKGRFGPALHLSGVSQCLMFGDRPELDPDAAMTVSAWIKADDWNGSRTVLRKGDGDNQYRLFEDGGKFAFDISGVGEVAGPKPEPHKWHHIAGTYDGAVMRLYIDGVLVAEKPASGKISVTPDSLYIGAKSSNAARSDYFKGDMDEIMIWDYALSPDHIQKLAKAGNDK